MANLADLAQGETAIVKRLKNPYETRRFLWDLGLVENTLVKCVMKGPRGDPVAYGFRGAVIALRESDARLVLIK